MRETVISLTDGRILGVRCSELSMDMIINLIQDLTYSYLEMVPLVKTEFLETRRTLSPYLFLDKST